MGNTNVDGIWTPDEEDTHEPDVWSAAMAESISQGLGKRMELQETRAGMDVRTPIGPFSLTGAGSISDTGIILPVQNTGGRNYINNIEVTGGIAKVQIPGLYLVVLMVTAGFSNNVPLDATLFIGSAADASQPFNTSPDAYTNATLTSALMLDVDDTIYGRLRVGAGRSDTVEIRGATLRATLLYATL